MDIQNIKEVVLFLCRLTDGVVKANADGNFNVFKDWPHFIDAGKALIPAVKDFKQVSAEYADMDEDEREELIMLIIDEFDLPDDSVEEFIEKAFKVALDLADLIEYGMQVF